MARQPASAMALSDLAQPLASRAPEIETDGGEKPLADLNEQLELILENVPVYIYVVDENNRFLAVNRAWRELMGDEYSSIVGRTLYEVFPEATAADFEKNNRKVLTAGSRLE